MGIYGKRGGPGVTADRKAETLVCPLTGERKRVFFGQRWLTFLAQDEGDRVCIRAHHSEAEARAALDAFDAACEHEFREWQKLDAQRDVFPGLPTASPERQPLVSFFSHAAVAARAA